MKKESNGQPRQQALTKGHRDLPDLEEALELAAAQMSGGEDYGYSPSDRIDLREYWWAVRKRLWLVLAVAFLTTSLVAIYMARKPDTYEAWARVQVDLENGDGSSKGGQIVVRNPVNDPNYFNTQLQILSGPGLLRRVVVTLDFENNRDFFRTPDSSRRSTWQNLLRMFYLGSQNDAPASIVADTSSAARSLTPSLSSADAGSDSEKLQPYVAFLQRGLRIEPVKDTRLIDIGFNHVDAGIATKVVNTIADVFVLSNLEKKTNANSTQGDFLQKRIAELQNEIRNGEERLINYTKNNQIVSFEANNTVVERLVALNQQLLQAENDRKAAQAAYEAAQLPGAAEALIRESQSQSPQAETAIAQLRQRRAQLLAKTTEEWPEVKEIDRQIEELQRQLDTSRTQSVATLRTNLRTRYQQALARENLLRGAFDQQKGETLTQNQAAINFKILQQEVNTNRGLLETLLQRSKENDVLMAGMGNNIHVVDYAVKPRAPMGVRRLTTVFLAFVISLALGVGLALLIDYLDESVKTERDVEKYLRLPTVGLIPIAKRRTHRLLLDKSMGGNGGKPEAIAVSGDQGCPLSEAYRHLRTSVLLSAVGGPPKTIVVTSSLPNEGKTTTAINLAVTLVKSGSKVLLIDGDMRRPSIHQVFGIDNDYGLSNIISSEVKPDEVLSMISHDPLSDLHILTAGPRPPNPADHLGSEKMRQLIKSFGSMYTHVIIDSPPLCIFTDGTLLSTMADSVLLVVEAGKGSHKAIRKARKMLDDVVANITGIVLNKVSLSAAGPYYYYTQYYGKTNGRKPHGFPGQNGDSSWSAGGPLNLEQPGTRHPSDAANN